MENYILWVIIAVISIILYIFKDEIINLTKGDKFPYAFKKRKFLLSKSEKELYNILKQNFQNYEIMAKIRLIDIIEPTGKGKNYLIAKNKIIQKHIDFLILSKGYLNPLLAIELNDSSHRFTKRNDRDNFLTLAFESAGMPIIFFNTKDLKNPEYVINLIKNKLVS